MADEVRKILRDHGSDPLPVTYQDFEALPELIAARQRVLTSVRPGKHPRIISLIPRGNTTIIVEEVRTGKDPQAFILKQGWAAVSLVTARGLMEMRSLYEHLQARILEMIEPSSLALRRAKDAG